MRRRFLWWSLLQAVFFCALLAAAFTADIAIHGGAKLAIGAILLTYVLASAHAGVCAYNNEQSRHLDVAIDLCPTFGVIGAAHGFLVAMGADVSDVVTAVLGASSSLAATIVGGACMGALKLVQHILDDPS